MLEKTCFNKSFCIFAVCLSCILFCHGSYCECFAAGVYCIDSCACENCFNKPEYVDKVLETREQIELRNPLAFAPKIVKHANDSPAYAVVMPSGIVLHVLTSGNWKDFHVRNILQEEGNRTTPSSARHKRGCNCKKSKCLKKYCECYQVYIQVNSLICCVAKIILLSITWQNMLFFFTALS